MAIRERWLRAGAGAVRAARLVRNRLEAFKPAREIGCWRRALCRGSQRLRVAAIVIGLVGALSPEAAGQASDGEGALLPRWQIGPYVGIARNSPAGRQFGAIPDRDHLFVGIQLTANVVRRPRWAFAYAPEVVPLLRISNNPTYHSVSTANGGRLTVVDGRGPVTGFAISPIGLQAQLRVAPRWRMYGAGAAGVVWFTRAVPVPGSRAFNYTFEIGAGLRWQYRPREALRVGYKFHHLSNAYTAARNPGLDAAVFLVGYERAIGSR